MWHSSADTIQGGASLSLPAAKGGRTIVKAPQLYDFLGIAQECVLRRHGLARQVGSQGTCQPPTEISEKERLVAYFGQPLHVCEVTLARCLREDRRHLFSPSLICFRDVLSVGKCKQTWCQRETDKAGQKERAQAPWNAAFINSAGIGVASFLCQNNFIPQRKKEYPWLTYEIIKLKRKIKP